MEIKCFWKLKKNTIPIFFTCDDDAAWIRAGVDFPSQAVYCPTGVCLVTVTWSCVVDVEVTTCKNCVLAT